MTWGLCYLIDWKLQAGLRSYNVILDNSNPDSKVHGANMGPTWILSAPDGSHGGPMNFAIWEDTWKHNTGNTHVNSKCFNII